MQLIAINRLTAQLDPWYWLVDIYHGILQVTLSGM